LEALTMTKTNTSVDFDDLLWGLPAIAREIKRTPRQAQYLVDQGVIDVLRVGPKTLIASRTQIRERFALNSDRTSTIGTGSS
jgi:hypothetical protein